MESPSCMSGFKEQCPACRKQVNVPFVFPCIHCKAMMVVEGNRARQWCRCSNCGLSTRSPSRTSSPQTPDDSKQEQPTTNEWTQADVNREFWSRLAPGIGSTSNHLAETQPFAESASKGCIRTKVRGVTHDNEDGSIRQQIIADRIGGEVLLLVRQPHNPHDANAIAVLATSSEMCGYISAELAEDIAPLMDSGMKIAAHVLEVTGGADGCYFGLNIEITINLDSSDGLRRI